MRRISNISIEFKSTIWEKNSFPDPNDINSFLLSLKNLPVNGDKYSSDIAEDLNLGEYSDNETLYDTIEEIPISENEGNYTVEIFANLADDKSRMIRTSIWDNKGGVTDEFKEWVNSQISSNVEKMKKIKL